MQRLCFLAVGTLLFISQAQASCMHVDNQEIIEYSCDGGSSADLQQIPSNAEKIRISNMPVGRLTESLFSRFGSNLIVLTCSHCQINDIEDTAFHKLNNLQQLSLDNNQLKEVKASWFEGLVFLTYLDLNYNEIERLDGDVFRNAPELVDLRLSGNRLQCLDVQSMTELKGLKRIFLNENPNFGCPNAVKKFLNEMHVDFEVDPYWNNVFQDKIRTNEALPPAPPAVPEDVRERMTPPPAPYYTRARWTVTEAPTTEETVPPTAPPTRRPYIPEMIQPSVPSSDFAFQGPYYAPKVTQQQIDSYRENATRQLQNATEAAVNKTADALPTLPTVLAAGYEPPTTECPNMAAPGISGSLLFSFLLVTVVVSQKQLFF